MPRWQGCDTRGFPFHATPCVPCVQSYPRQVPPSFFQDRIPGVTKYQSEALVGVMRKVGALNATDYLVPGVWPLDAAVAELPWLAADARLQAAVATQLRLAAGDHENLGARCGKRFGGRQGLSMGRTRARASRCTLRPPPMPRPLLAPCCRRVHDRGAGVAGGGRQSGCCRAREGAG